MSGGGGGAVRAVKSQGGGAVARWRSVRVSGRRWASMGPTHLAWMDGMMWIDEVVALTTQPRCAQQSTTRSG